MMVILTKFAHTEQFINNHPSPMTEEYKNLKRSRLLCGIGYLRELRIKEKTDLKATVCFTAL